MRGRSDNRPLIDPHDEGWKERFLLASEAVTRTERRELAELALNRHLVRLRRGVYLRPPAGDRPEDRHLDLVRAYAIERPELVFSHRSAASVWRLPRLDSWPDTVDVAESITSSRRSTDGITRRATAVEFDAVTIEGVAVTSLSRTALDLARVDSIPSGLAAIDAALRGIRMPGGMDERASRTMMLDDLERMPGSRGVEGARWVVEFADGRAELPGESVSRLQIHRLGLTTPLLQHEFRDSEGSMFADFHWPEFGLVGEFDGAGKYLPGSPADLVREVVLREKRREDRLRNLGERVVRWDWATALDRRRLGSLLFSAGVR